MKIPNPWEGASVFVKEGTRSTMDDALELALRGFPVGTAVIAGFQESGRGRVQGRRWVSEPWQSLLLSVVLADRPLGFSPTQLPLRIAVGVCRALEGLPLEDVRIKWPNDVLLGGRKLAGILCEGRRGFFTCGVGINCGQEEFPPGLAETACSLRQAGLGEVSVFGLCGLVLPELKRAMSDREWKSGLDDRLEGRGSIVTVRAPGSGGAVTGRMDGVDGEGALLLSADGRAVAIPQGEVMRSP